MQKNCTKNVCITIESKLCNEDFEVCRNVTGNETAKPTCHYNAFKDENHCWLLTQKIRYNIYHNGTNGITRVVLLIVLKNVTYGFIGQNYQFRQSFEVNFFWSNQVVNYSSLMSGNPGYLPNKFILIGNLVGIVNITNITGTNMTNTHINYEIHRNPLDIPDNFLVFPDNKDGYCKLTNSTYVPVEFGLNMLLKCTLREQTLIYNKNASASIMCQKVQEKIFKYFFVRTNNISLVVGKFGNSDANVINDWQKALYEDNPLILLNRTSGKFDQKKSSLTCANITSSVSVKIFYSRIDTKEYQNQQKLNGLAFTFGLVDNYVFEIKDSLILSETPLRMDVMFFDITKPKIKKYVDPPTFRIRLPYDFFYPFVKLENSANTFSAPYFLINCIILYLHNCYSTLCC